MSKWVVTEWRDYYLWALSDGNRVIEFQFEPMQKTAAIGDIYIGKVKNVASNLNAAFVDVGDGVLCYLPQAGDVKAGQEFPVQIYKEAIKTKAPVITRELSLTGSVSVLVFGSKGIHTSKKINDAAWKKDVTEKLAPYQSDEYSLVLRTHAYEVPFEIMEKEVQEHIAEWQRLKDTMPYRACYTKLWQAKRDWLNLPVEEIVTDIPELYKSLADANTGMPLRLYEDKLLPLAKLYSIETWLERATERNVWLKSGGYLVIEPTEALVSIDINTGKYEGKKTKEETFLKINLEAAVEIAAQLRLRNLSGMILIDFINMREDEEKRKVMDTLAIELKKDKTKSVVVDMTKLGLVEVTRKREHRPVSEYMKIR